MCVSAKRVLSGQQLERALQTLPDWKANSNGTFIKATYPQPDYISGFIRDIENMGGAAKISGAGNIKSNSKSAGIVMVVGLDKQSLKDLSEQNGYNILPR